MRLILVELLLSINLCHSANVSDHGVPEEDLSSHRQNVHENMTLKSVVKSARIIAFREAEEVHNDTDS